MELQFDEHEGVKSMVENSKLVSQESVILVVGLRVEHVLFTTPNSMWLFLEPGTECNVTVFQGGVYPWAHQFG
jgi:hypothetical protein